MERVGIETAIPREGEVLVVRLPPGRVAREAIVLRDEHGAVRAYENVCQHVPIPLDAGGGAFFDDDAQLVCATHGAVYRRSDGECVSGPCMGRRLAALPFVIEGERVRITIDR
ncbi:MAG: Rieske 2Fe-2S domain-containing protein [Sandaracinaceae bacterium]|nr:Rieske 2Fe-2S domain-containing protein [Sandaracinaceae bacterium]